MKQIINIYRHITTNIGDLFSTPALYFDELKGIERLDIWKDDFIKLKGLIKDKVIILGGGGLIANSDFEENIRLIINAKPKYAIFWGAGHNTHNGSQIVYPDYVKQFDLVGIRDFNVKEYQWVPCSSCLHPLFNEKYKITHPVVVYEHKNFPLNITEYPIMNNRGDDLSKVLQFLSSGEVVITNTYHGAYWATLLGRKVIVIDPFSTKFSGLKHQPTFASINSYENNLNDLISYPESLEECIQANLNFNKQFIALTNLK